MLLDAIRQLVVQHYGPIKLNYHRGKKLFRKCIGTKLGADGKIKARIFWLGADQVKAIKAARILGQCWEELNHKG